MHPAFSVIFFTVASGTGYGLLFLIGLLGVLGLLPIEPKFGLYSIITGLALVTFGLLSSTYHLGHRERALGALSQWRTSWLSREGVVSAAAYGPILLLLYVWFYRGGDAVSFPVWAMLTAVLSALTVFSTGMIYRSLATIHQWYNQWTVPVYMAMALAGGGVTLLALLGLFAIDVPTLPYCVAASIALAWAVKVMYWRFVDTTQHQSTPESATGLGSFGTVRMLEGPHTEDNFLLTEMGYQIGRKHAAKLRRYAHILGFALPIALTLGSSGTGLLSIAAACSFLLGAVVERWLFFAEAKHTVTLYYGAERV
jgi:sulfite dehydrogenase (quinone) subunit SoeC